MESKEDGDGTEEWPTSPYQVLQQISEEAFRAAGEAIQSVYLGSSLNNQPPGPEPGHRRCQSEVLTGAEHRRSNSFQRWKSQMQRALRWGNNPREQSRCLAFNPEVLANQKRQWYQLHSKASVNTFLHLVLSFWKSFKEFYLIPERTYAKRVKPVEC